MRGMLFGLFMILVTGCWNIHHDPDGYYEDGNLYLWDGARGTGNMEEGKKEGFWTYRNPQRVVIGKGFFKNDLMDGEWNLMYDNGIRKSHGNFKEEKRDGDWEFWWEDGSLESKGSFREGLREGNWQYWFPNGQLMSRGLMQEDRRTGLWEFWYPNGQQQEIRVYKNGLNYLGSSWGPDGYPMVVNGSGDYAFIEEGLVLEKGSYRDSLAVGTWEFFDRQGNPTGSRNFVDGIGQ